MNTADTQALRALLLDAPLSLTEEKIEKTLRFYQFLLAENQTQNLTRIVSPGDFFNSNVLDVSHLLSLDWVRFPAVDLGSGCGVPGLLAAIFREDPWVLAEAELQKAAFLERARLEIGLNHVSVVHQRVEKYLENAKTQTIVARAVGPVDRIYSWLEKCSTWNTLILLKGPGWDEEWERFARTRFRNRLKLIRAHPYTVGAEKKKRVIVQLENVPRGTR